MMPLRFVGAVDMLLLLFAGCESQPAGRQSPILRDLISGSAVHGMNRTAIEAELNARNTPYETNDSIDRLRMRLYEARALLLQHRNRLVMHAEQENDDNDRATI